MKHLKSTSEELRSIFENNISVRDIYEDLEYCNVNDDAMYIKNIMEEKEFDVFGILKDNVLFGYIKQDELKEGLCEKYQNPFKPTELISDSTPLIELLSILHDQPRIFVLKCNRVVGIITHGDLQKAPVRMLLFGLISLLEMNLLRLIKSYYPDDSWKGILSNGRIKQAENLLNTLKERNEGIDLADCLQFCDKRKIILNNQEIVERIWQNDKNSLRNVLKGIQELRNKLAHSQDIITGSSLPETIKLIKQLESLLRKCEELI